MEKGNRIMAVDLGTKRIGLAVSDPTLTIAQPLTVLKREGNKKDIPKIIQFIQSYDVNTIVIGIPSSDRDSFMAKSAERFAGQLKEAYNITIDFIDESMTSIESEEIFRMAGIREKKSRQMVDKIAAAKILESYLRQRELKGK